MSSEFGATSKNQGRHEPLLELRVDDPVGEALAADTDALKHTVALQLVEHESRIDETYKPSTSRLSPAPALAKQDGHSFANVAWCQRRVRLFSAAVV